MKITETTPLQLLSEKKEIRGELGPMLWNSFGTIAILLKEITAVYRILSSPNIPDQVLNRVCNALAILQSVAVHPDTRRHFIKANMPQYLYPFLSTLNKEKPQEYLRISSLGVIGSLAKSEDVEVIHFLIETQVFPHCLRCMEIGSAISKAVATLIVQKILMSDDGMKYCCTLADRFFVICCSLRQMVDTISEEPSSKQLLKYIVRCYLRLSENPRALDGLICCLPPKLTDASIINLLRDDRTAMGWLNQLLYNISTLHPKHRNLSRFARPLMRTETNGKH
ncbi:Cell differentiation, Rcd1-like protein [Quillaja saponaria]|uniref:Cell differentiation, Rcd1-like protein n=1 Tax=Quillaja saponaria TaxID=32244 RepID=A0AAD7QGZ4_QUISA|nr:Cell differentiation, Rcd1-like protein [Quillaja saponaria]